MSDSAPRKDVEDVLSSIRRLVSSEQPRNRRPALPAGPGALVLTDAQRVEKPAPKARAGKSLEDRIAELEAAVSSREDEYEPDGSEDQALHRPDRIVYSRPPTDAEEAEARGQSLRMNRLSLVGSGETTPETPKERAMTPAAFRHERGPRPDDNPGEIAPAEEARMAEDVAETPSAKAEIRAFHNPDDMVGRFEARIDRGELPPPPGPDRNGFSERLESFQATRTTTGETGESSARDLSADDRAGDTLGDDDFEAALNEAVTRPLPSAQTVAGEAGITPLPREPEDPGAAAAAAAAPQAPKPVQPAPSPVRQDAVLAGLDDELLRPIVARLIREELQGELGERITRNVRKLVRREILRAINSQEFE